MMNRRLQIGLVGYFTIHDRMAHSGIPYSVSRALQQHVGDVVEIGPFPTVPTPLPARLLRRGVRVLSGRMYWWPHSRSCIKGWARRVEAAVSRRPCDVVFAPRAKWIVALARLSQPLVVFSDSTIMSLRSMGGYYIDDIPTWQLRKAARIERDLYERSALILVSSEWGRRAIVDGYGIDTSKVVITPNGANVLPSEVPALPSGGRRLSDRSVRLLWIGMQWYRKGGETAIGILRELREIGVDATLTIVGSSPPRRLEDPAIEVIARLDKNFPDEAARLFGVFQRCDFHILPTLGDTFGISSAEACAFGLPTIASDVGGVSEVVLHDRNGWLLPSGATPADYARAIVELANDPPRYRRLSATARSLYETRFNWDSWGAKTALEIEARHLGEPAANAAFPPAQHA